MTNATYTNPQYRPGVVRLRAGRLAAVLLLLLALVVGGGLWFLHLWQEGKTPPVESTMRPAWMKQPSDAIPLTHRRPPGRSTAPPDRGCRNPPATRRACSDNSRSNRKPSKPSSAGPVDGHQPAGGQGRARDRAPPPRHHALYQP